MSELLAGKRALVTGASRGVGKQISYALGQLGCRLILHARKKDNLKETAGLVQSLGIDIDFVEGDLSNKEGVLSIIEQVKAIEPDIDILYNNAAMGSTYRHNIFAHTWEEWETMFSANVFALYTLASTFVPGMIERGYGRVINLTSGIKHQPQLAPYGATKAAVDKITDDIAIALPPGVRMNTVDPGWLKTDMGGEHAEHPVQDVLPGILVPLFVEDDGPNGQFFSAIDYDQRVVEKYNLQDLKPALE